MKGDMYFRIQVFEDDVYERFASGERREKVLDGLLEVAWRVLRTACSAVGGHDPVMDHCGMPKHDYCSWCGASTPGGVSRGRRPAGKPGLPGPVPSGRENGPERAGKEKTVD